MAEPERKFLHEQTRDNLIDNLKAIPREVAAAVNGKIAQGASELASALYAGSAFVQYGAEPVAPQEPQHGVHGPEDVGQKAEAAAEFQEAKQQAVVNRAIDKEVDKMTPEQQQIAASFLEPPQQPDPLEQARSAWKSMAAEQQASKGKDKGMEIG